MKKSELQSLIRECVCDALKEAIDIHNDESAMKALEDIAANMTKWKGSEGAHYTDLLEKVIDFLKYGNHRTN